MQAKRVWCKAAESVRGASGVAEALAAGRGGRTSGAPGVSISSTLPGVEERVEEGDVGPSSAGPQQKLGPGSSSAIALTQPMPLHWLLLLFALLGLQLQPRVGIDEQDCRPGRTCSPRIVATSLDFVEPQRLHQLLLLPPSWWPSGGILDGSRGLLWLLLFAQEAAHQGPICSLLEIHSSKNYDLLARDSQTQPGLKEGCYARPFFW